MSATLSKIEKRKAQVRSYNQRRRQADYEAFACRACGQKAYTTAGCWCWKCYRELIDDDGKRTRLINAAREARIQLYEERAEKELPLFET